MSKYSLPIAFTAADDQHWADGTWYAVNQAEGLVVHEDNVIAWIITGDRSLLAQV